MSVEASSGRVALRPGESLRTRAARGTLVNGAFLVGLQTLGLLKGFVVAAFLTREDYGVWGLLVVGLGTLTWLTQIGVDDKYTQQNHPDQELAFQVAFTMQAALLGAFSVLLLLALPGLALIYGRWDILAPGAVVVLALPAAALQMPQWVFYRRMDFMRQRTLQAVDPVVSFVVTCVLAATGFGYWAFVLGLVAGYWSGALVAVRASPYPLRWRWDSSALREYASFSWPLFVAQGSGVVIAQVPILVAQRTQGTAAVGAIALAATVTLWAGRMDDLVTNALYPAICAVKERRDLLLEAFRASNRLALLWAVPIGTGIALFAGPLVHDVLGDRWAPAIPLLQSFGLSAALNQVAFNWTAFLRALGRTRPVAVSGGVMLAAVLLIPVPLLAWRGIGAYGWGMLAATGILVLLRVGYLRRLLPGLRILPHIARGIAPTVLPALAVILLGVPAAIEVALYAVLVLVLTLVLERESLRELRGYLSGRAPLA